MALRFFADETDLGLGRRLEQKLPGRVVYPGHPDFLEVPRGQNDDEWMAVVGNQGKLWRWLSLGTNGYEDARF